jgi:hypothetical protein
MLMQLFSRLKSFSNLEDYHYIGFGSIFFTDFIMVHKLLNISKMTSIEWDRNKFRASWNLPYNAIRLVPGDCNEELPNIINENEKNITWLDYDDPIEKAFLKDINTYVSNTSSGSILLVSANVHPYHKGNSPLTNNEYRLKRLQNDVGEENIPIDITGKNLKDWGFSSVTKSIVFNTIKSNLNIRNKTIDYEKQLKVKQIININYQDGAQMMTVGYIFYQRCDEGKFRNCKFHTFDFTSFNSTPFEIEVPSLTFKEIQLLNTILPRNKDGASFSLTTVPSESIDAYEKIYQYFPNYIENNFY